MVLSASSIFCSTKWVCSFFVSFHSLIRQVVRIPRKRGTISQYYWLLVADLRCQRTVVAFIFMNDTFQSVAYVILPELPFFLPDSPLSLAWFIWLGSTGNALWFGTIHSELIFYLVRTISPIRIPLCSACLQRLVKRDCTPHIYTFRHSLAVRVHPHRYRAHHCCYAPLHDTQVCNLCFPTVFHYPDFWQDSQHVQKQLYFFRTRAHFIGVIGNRNSTWSRVKTCLSDLFYTGLILFFPQGLAIDWVRSPLYLESWWMFSNTPIALGSLSRSKPWWQVG